MIQKGEIAPPLAAMDHEGRARTVADLTGARGLILLFYRGYW